MSILVTSLKISFETMALVFGILLANLRAFEKLHIQRKNPFAYCALKYLNPPNKKKRLTLSRCFQSGGHRLGGACARSRSRSRTAPTPARRSWQS